MMNACLAGVRPHGCGLAGPAPAASGQRARLLAGPGAARGIAGPRRTGGHPARCQVADGPDAAAAESAPSTSRRGLLLGSTLGAAAAAAAARLPAAWAEGSPAAALSVADMTPALAPPAALTAAEQALVDVFSRSTYSVVNIVDVALRAGVGGVDVPEGNGSGVVWDTQGHIVTNYHVIASSLASTGGAAARTVARVTLLGADGFQQTLTGVLVGADRSHDLAVLQVAAPPEVLRPIPLGTSADLRVGQQVLAIGNPFGFDHTLTSGIVSGLDREIQSMATSIIAGGIQTDAAINPGNSGGPLLDSRGRLVGINTAIYTRTGTSSGVGFALPVDTAARVVPQLIQFGRVVTPSLGAQIAKDDVAKQLRAPTGALLQSVAPGGAAAKAGLLPIRRGLAGIMIGDVITACDGRPIRGDRDLAIFLDGASIGQKVALTLSREGQPLSVDVVLQDEAAGGK